ncbi:MAG TPA: CBS domain-containing protein [Nitrospiria bacterium]|nr:CBS domain-containing protein [Nitrospiria bacterium]
MKVKDLMTAKVITVSPADKVDRVFFFFNFEKIRHLPVVENSRLVGIVSDRDLKKVLGSLKTSRSVEGKNHEVTVTIRSRTVRTIMRRGVITTSPNADASEAAAIMAKNKIGALPVVRKDKLVGIITATDILKAFVRLSREYLALAARNGE